MPDLSTYQQTILSAQLLMAQQLTANINQLSIGNGFVSYATPRELYRYWNALQYQLNRPDLTSNTTLAIYDKLQGLIGIDTTVNNVDPNFQYPGINITGGSAGIGTQIVQIPFTNATGYTINWQTDIPTGYSQTYAQLLGNYFPNPVVYFNGTGYIDSGSVPTVTRPSGLIQTVVFDWGQSQSGFIRF